MGSVNDDIIKLLISSDQTISIFLGFGLWSKRRQVKMATVQNSDKPKRRQVHGEITKMATNQKVNIATQYECVKE